MRYRVSPVTILALGGVLLASVAVRAQGIPPGSAPSQRASVAAIRARLQAVLDSAHAAGQAPGISAGVVLSDGTSFGITSGLADTALKVPLRPTDKLLQGSVGKTYVAAVAMQLVHEGKIGLDERIERYLGREPWFSRLAHAREITVRHLMSHTSGVVRYEFKPEFTRDLTANPMKAWRPEEQIAYLLDDPAPFRPGEGWEYSDTNYILLGMIIERVTGGSYYAELRRRILEPLGLRNTAPSDSRRIPGLAQGYAGPRNPFGGADAMVTNGEFAINPQFEWTGGGIASTSEDLARWAKALYEGRAFDPSLIPQMLDAVPSRLGPTTRYGLGVMVRTTPLGTTYGHSGFFPGYLTEVMYFPETKTAIAVQVNTSTVRSPAAIVMALARVLSTGGT
jgi:D-alanyl-D-alanine carboxypeptidase